MMMAITITTIKKAYQYLQTTNAIINRRLFTAKKLSNGLSYTLLVGISCIAINANANSFDSPLIINKLDGNLSITNTITIVRRADSSPQPSISDVSNISDVSSISDIGLIDNSLAVNNDRLSYQLPTKLAKICLIRNNCPKVRVEYVVSNQPWIDRVINERVNQLVVDSADMVFNTTSYDDTQELIKFDDVQKSLDAFAMAQFMDLPANTDQFYTLSIVPKYLGKTHNIEQFQIVASIDMGGEYGLGVPYSERMMFDQRSQKLINIDSLIEKGQQPRFLELAHSAYRRWIVQSGANVQVHEQAWPFVLTKNIGLGNQGVELMYQPYKIASYEQGSPMLIIPYQQLQGVLNPQLFSNQTSNSQALDGQILDNQASNSQTLDRQILNNQTLNSQILDNQASSSQTLDRQILNNQTLNSQILDNQASNSQTLDRQILNNIDGAKNWQNLNMNDFYNQPTTNYGR